MKIDFKQIPKFVINLKRRSDRLTHVTKEFEYMDWSFERFEAVDTNSYIGCALSHQQIAKIILERNYDYAMVLEDDIFFMPYAKEQIEYCEQELAFRPFDFFHLAPSLHRPVNNISQSLMDITNLPPKDETKHREVFGTSGFIVNKKACEYILNWNTNKYFENSHQQLPIDEFLAKAVYPNIIALASSLPIVTQLNDYSDINHGEYNSHYTMTYNWNVYTANKLSSNMMDIEYCRSIRNED